MTTIIPSNLPPRPADGGGLPSDGAAELERLRNAPDVVLQADYDRLLDRERHLRSQLDHISRRIERVRTVMAERRVSGWPHTNDQPIGA